MCHCSAAGGPEKRDGELLDLAEPLRDVLIHLGIPTCSTNKTWQVVELRVVVLHSSSNRHEHLRQLLSGMRDRAINKKSEPGQVFQVGSGHLKSLQSQPQAP